jgi:hypothetical protein
MTDLTYYQQKAVEGMAAAYVLANESVSHEKGNDDFHRWLALWSFVETLPVPLARLFLDERMIFTFEKTGMSGGSVPSPIFVVHPHVLCNDLFWWASADAESLLPEHYPALLTALEESPNHGELLWVARMRGMRPQRPYYAYFSEYEKELFNEVGPERTE